MGYYIVPQMKKGSEVLAKAVSFAPTEDGGFRAIPPVIRLYVGNTSWGSPVVLGGEVEGRPAVWTITLNPRTGVFNWHHGFGHGERVDRTREGERVVRLDPVSGTVSTMGAKLATAVGADLAGMIVDLLATETGAVMNAMKPARKARKPRKKVDKKLAAQEAVDERLRQWAARRAA